MEQMRAVVAQSLERSVSAITVARRHGISTGQLYTWRYQVRANSAAIGIQCPHSSPALPY